MTEFQKADRKTIEAAEAHSRALADYSRHPSPHNLMALLRAEAARREADTALHLACLKQITHS